MSELIDLVIEAAREFPDKEKGEIESIARLRLQRRNNQPGDILQWWMQDRKMEIEVRRALSRIN